jgi:hypothetical protein
MKFTLITALVSLVGALVLAGCGIGEAGPEAKVSKRATDHLNALVDGDTSAACRQLSPGALEKLGGAARCGEALQGDYGPELEDAALDIHVDGKRATASLESGTRELVFVRDDRGQWWIDAGFTTD